MRLVKSLNVVLLLPILLSLCTCANPDISSSKQQKIDQTTVTTIETQAKEPEETEPIEDKFFMLREVYDILSGPLGEPYRTPEYWGGEEIDMMRVGDGYLIGLRNVQNQMHYLLYERETNSIIEIDTQGKHIPWDEIDYYVDKQELSFPYYIPDDQTRKVKQGTITYSLADHSYQYTESDSSSLAYPENLFEILDPVFTLENQTYTFDFLADILDKLPEIYFTDHQGWMDFGQSNICILRHKNSVLICLQGQAKYYYLYQKSGAVSAITPLDVPNTFWDMLRFQQDEEYLIFPSPTGQRIPNVSFSFADFPYITLLSLNSPTNSIKRKLPLWDQEEEKHYLLGRTLCYAEWKPYRIWQSENEFSIEWELREPNVCPSGYDCCPEIRVKTSPNRSVTVWTRNNILSEEDEQKLRSLQIDGIQNIQLFSATLQEIEPMIEGKTKEELMEEGTCLSFTLEEGYQLYGEFSCTDIFSDHWTHPEASLYFSTAKE